MTVLKTSSLPNLVIDKDHTDQQKIRNDFSDRNGTIHLPPTSLSHHHSDSEMNTDIGHDSEEEDNDYIYEEIHNIMTAKLLNGVYEYSDSFDDELILQGMTGKVLVQGA